jgi:DNA-directed RNA polymerase specialized sigma24 family protein
MNQNDILDYICHRETVREILSIVEPTQLSVMALRWSGMDNMQIAQSLGVTHQAVTGRLSNARKRISFMLPDVAPMIEGRRNYSHSAGEPDDALDF